MKKTRNTKNEKGITLIILVVTIVVILILAGITVDIAFSDSGMIKSALGIQEKINSEIENDESRMNKLQGEITNGSINSGGGLVPDMNIIEGGGTGGEETTPPLAPQVKIQGTEGETGCYRSEVEVTVIANDRSDNLTYTIEGTGIEQGSVSTETPIANGQSIKVTGDGAYTITIYAYNRNGQKSEGRTVNIVKDTVAPNGSLAVTKKTETTITVQLVADDPEPSSGLASSNPYTFYYKEEGTDTWVEAGKGSTSTYTYEGLKETASYSLKAEITDKAGNQGTSNEVLNIPTEGNVALKEITDWTKPNIHKDETTSFTIETTKPVKVTNETNLQLEPNTTGCHVTIQAIDPDENGYATKFTVTVTGGNGNGPEAVVIPQGTLQDEKGNTLETIRKEGVTVDNTKPGIGNIERPGGDQTIGKGEEAQEIILTPSEPGTTVDPDKFKPVDKDGNEINDPNTKVDVAVEEDGKIHISITGGDKEGEVDIKIEEGGITDPAGNKNEETIIDTNVTVDNTKPGIGDISKPNKEIITKDETAHITITPTEQPVTVDPSKFIPVDENGNPIDATVTIKENPDGTIEITITGGNDEGTVNIKVEPGALTDKAGNTNDQTTIETGVTVDNTKPGIGEVTKPTEEETIKKGDTSTEIILKPTEQPVIIDPDKFIPVDENGNPITDTTTKVEVTKDDEGNIHIIITGGDKEGEVNIEIQPGGITDPAGNQNDTITIDTNVTIDNTKPTMDITKPEEGTILKKEETLEITIKPSEAVTTHPDKITLTGEGSAGTTVQVKENPDGTITVTVTGGTATGEIAISIEEGFLTDKAGNPNTKQTLPTYQIDNSAPTVTASITGTTTSSITIKATATDNGPAGIATEDAYTYHITGAGIDKTITTNQDTHTFTDLPANQEYTITVTVTDKKGNSGTSTPIKHTTGTIPDGQGSITFGDAKWENETASITVTKQASLTQYTMQYQIIENAGQVTEDGWIDVTGDTVTVKNLLHSYQVLARLVDNSGNKGKHGSVTILDDIAPTVTLQEASTPTQGNVTITVTIVEKESGIQTQKYAQGTQTETYFQTAGTEFTGTTFEATANGVWTVYVEDKAGNKTVQTITVTKKDNTKPGIGNIDKPETQTPIKKKDTIEIILTPTEPDVTIEPDKFIPVDNNGNEITDPTTTVEVTKDDEGNIHIIITGGDKEGEVNIKIQEGGLTDPAGNQNDETTIDTNVTVDNTKPTTNIQKPADGTIIKNGEDITITLTPSETVTINPDKIILTGDGSTGTTKQVSQNPDGTISIIITGGTDTGTIGIELQPGALTDKAGNANDSIIYEKVVEIDNHAPTVNASVTGNTSSSITVAVTATDNGPAGLATEDTYTYHITGNGIDKTVTTTDTTYTFKNLPQGKDYTITVTATDNKGNTGISTSITGTTESVPEGNESITFSTETWANEQASLTITKLATLTGYTLQYKVTDEMGTTLTDWINVAGNSQVVSGLFHNNTVMARLIDLGGNTGGSKSQTIQDSTAPSITLKEPTTPTQGNVTITVTIVEKESGIQTQKYAQGTKAETYFQTAGTAFTGTTFEATANGTWSVYAEDKAGNKTIQTITVTKKDNTKPGIGTITKPTEEEIIKKGDTSTEIILKPTEQPVTIDPDKFKPVDKDGNEITDPNTNITITQDDDGNIHITITGGDQEGKINIELQPGAITDEAGNENNDITIDTNITVDNTKPSIQKTEVSREDIIKQADQVIITLTPSEDITLDISKITLTGDGSTGATKQVTQNPDGTITITLTGGTGTGTIGIELQPGALTDKAGNSNDTITLDTIAQIDNSAPTISAQVTATTSNSITVAVTATDNGPAGLATENTYTYHITGEGVDKTIPTIQATYTFQDLPQGKDYHITITVKDAKDNTATTTLTATTGTVPEGQGNITLSSITWNQDGSPEKEGTAKITVTNNKPAYTMQYQIVRRRNTENRRRMDRGRRRSNRSGWITS